MLSRPVPQGRDIPPDENRVNYYWSVRAASEAFPTSQQVSDQTYGHEPNDLEEDGPVTIGLRPNTSVSLFEPLDSTLEQVATIHSRVFNHRRQQQHNGTGYYNDERNRLLTFSDWLYQHVVRREDLAKNGFIYTGTADKVRCVFCNTILRQWNVQDVVEAEHSRASPICPFVRGETVGNIPLTHLPNGYQNEFIAPSTVYDSDARGHDIDPIEDRYGANYESPMQIDDIPHHDHRSSAANSAAREVIMENGVYTATPQVTVMSLKPNRLATFANWPPQMKQKPEQLAECGLYYAGDGDKVKCFHCGGELYNWDPKDDVFFEHARWFPSCQYMRLIRSEEFIKNAKSGSATNQGFMHTPAVMAALDGGYSVDQVQQAVDTLKKEKGNAVDISAQMILETIYKLEDAAHGAAALHCRPNVEEVEKLQKENESLKDKQLCKVCMERDVEVIFYPCKHFVCCSSCGTGLSLCPICRKQIASVDKVYMA